MIKLIIKDLLDNKIADLVEMLREEGFTENPGLARGLRKLADSLDIPSEDPKHPTPEAWVIGDVE